MGDSLSHSKKTVTGCLASIYVCIVLFCYTILFSLRKTIVNLEQQTSELDDLRIRVQSLDSITDSDTLTISQLQEQVCASGASAKSVLVAKTNWTSSLSSVGYGVGRFVECNSCLLCWSAEIIL